MFRFWIYIVIVSSTYHLQKLLEIICSSIFVVYYRFRPIALYHTFLFFQAILNETSHGLHLLTKQQAYIKSFQVVLPKSWSVPACQPGRKVTSRQTPLSHPDITISTRNPFYGGEGVTAPLPWTEQHAGCGQQGLGIHLPTKFLDFKVADEATTLSGRRRYYKDTWELRRKGT